MGAPEKIVSLPQLDLSQIPFARLVQQTEENPKALELAFNKADHFNRGRVYHAYGVYLKEGGKHLLRDAKKEYVQAERTPSAELYAQLVLLSADLKENLGSFQLYLQKFFELSPDCPENLYTAFQDLQEEAPTYAQRILDFICENYPNYSLAHISQIQMQMNAVLRSGKQGRAALKDLQAIKAEMDSLNITPEQDANGTFAYFRERFRIACVRLNVDLGELDLPMEVPSLSAERQRRHLRAA